MIIHVVSIEGLDYDYPTIWQKKPVLCIGEHAFSVLPIKAQQGKIYTLTDKDGKSIEMRLQKIEPYSKPNTL